MKLEIFEPSLCCDSGVCGSEPTWDFVITVCDIAKESCHAFSGNVKNSIYLKFEDPLAYEGDDEFLLKLIRTTRTQIVNVFEDFYNEFITSK